MEADNSNKSLFFVFVLFTRQHYHENWLYDTVPNTYCIVRTCKHAHTNKSLIFMYCRVSLSQDESSVWNAHFPRMHADRPNTPTQQTAYQESQVDTLNAQKLSRGGSAIPSPKFKLWFSMHACTLTCMHVFTCCASGCCCAHVWWSCKVKKKRNHKMALYSSVEVIGVPSGTVASHFIVNPPAGFLPSR